MRIAVLTLALLASLSATATAQSPLAPPAAWPAEVFETATDGIEEDSQNDRAVLATTAQIQPRRTVTLQYDFLHLRHLGGDDNVTGWIGVAGLKVGVTDRLQLSVQTTRPRDGSLDGPGFKYQLIRDDSYQLAGYGAVYFAELSSRVQLLGVVASRCLDPTCGALVSANLSYRFAEIQDAGALMLEASLLLPLVDHVKLVGELVLADIESSDQTIEDFTGRAHYGVRLHGWRAAATLSVSKSSRSLGSSPEAVWLTGSIRY